MKISLALGPRRPLSRQTAWGCFTTNATLPGAGSLLAGRGSGYAQLALSVCGLILTGVFTFRFMFWYAENWTHFHDPTVDPITTMTEMWAALRWPLLAMAIFIVGWLWALLTSLAILHEARRDEGKNLP